MYRRRRCAVAEFDTLINNGFDALKMLLHLDQCKTIDPAQVANCVPKRKACRRGVRHARSGRCYQQ